MKSLLVLFDRSARSFCYYDAPGDGQGPTSGSLCADEPDVMSERRLTQVVAYASAQGLALQVICGPSGLPEYARAQLDGLPAICYAPPSGCRGRGDVAIIEAHDTGTLDSIEPGAHDIAVLRVAPDAVPELASRWQRLSRRVPRIVLVLVGVDRYDEQLLTTYDQQLAAIRGQLVAEYGKDCDTQLNVLSDRLALVSPVHCSAGVDHVTVDPAGRFYLCPGFALDGSSSIGSLSTGLEIVNPQLLQLDHAPLCSICDAFHCRRCVYLNQRATLELNTPPWQVCRAAHQEREQSRVMLSLLHDEERLRHLPPIPTIAYLDPIDVLLKKAPRAATPRRRRRRPQTGATKVKQEVGRDAPVPAPAPAPPPASLGRVDPSERSEIQSLYLRRRALRDLFGTLAAMDEATLATTPLYDRVLQDMGEVSYAFDMWWKGKAAKYGWPQGGYRIDFASCEVFQE